jgi:hypothetical protein
MFLPLGNLGNLSFPPSCIALCAFFHFSLLQNIPIHAGSVTYFTEFPKEGHLIYFHLLLFQTMLHEEPCTAVISPLGKSFCGTCNFQAECIGIWDFGMYSMGQLPLLKVSYFSSTFFFSPE